MRKKDYIRMARILENGVSDGNYQNRFHMIYSSDPISSSGYLSGRFSRFFYLDVLRGIALTGLLFFSIRELGGFTANEQLRLQLAASGGNYQLNRIVTILLEGKMLGLLSLVFGAGIILFFSARRPAESLGTTDLYIRRQLWLLVFGIFTGIILLWPYDVLFPFAVAGILLFVCWRMSRSGLLFLAILFTLLYTGKIFWNYADDKKAYKKYLAVVAREKKISQDSVARFQQDSIWAVQHPAEATGKKRDSLEKRNDKDTLIRKLVNDSLAKLARADTLTTKEAEEKGAWEATLKNLRFDSTADKANAKMMRASYGKMWYHLLPKTQGREASWFYRTGIWEIGAMLLLGMALYKWNFFSSRFSRRRYLLIGFLALVAGLALLWLRMSLRAEQLADYSIYIQKRKLPYHLFLPVETMLLTLSYVSLILWTVRLQPAWWIWKLFASIGQMALTNYLIYILAATLFFYGYGFGFYGHLHQWQLYGVAAEIWMVAMVFSVFWLRRYRIGPAEWCWLSLMHGKKMPHRQIKETTADSNFSTSTT